MDTWLVDNLACPRHLHELSISGRQLRCSSGCLFPVVDGIPVMLLNDARQTIDVARSSIELSHKPQDNDDPLYIESLGLSEDEKAGIRRLTATQAGGIDPVVSFLVAATNGIAYKSLVGRLQEYPIPELRLPVGRGEIFLDLGCSWGRWCMAAARKGYRAIGVDPSLGAVMAARRVANALGLQAAFLVGDARFLPFKSHVVDRVFSYSVLQHLSREDVARVAGEIRRVLVPRGSTFIQMPTKYGIRCLYHQARRRFREAESFDVRYWSRAELHRLFSSTVGPTRFSVDCFFGIGLQRSDRHLMTPAARAAVTLSEFLRSASELFPPVGWVADSIYVSATSADAG